MSPPRESANARAILAEDGQAEVAKLFEGGGGGVPLFFDEVCVLGAPNASDPHLTSLSSYTAATRDVAVAAAAAALRFFGECKLSCNCRVTIAALPLLVLLFLLPDTNDYFTPILFY